MLGNIAETLCRWVRPYWKGMWTRMSISSITSASVGVQSAVKSLVTTQQEAQSEATAGIKDGDENVGTNVNQTA